MYGAAVRCKRVSSICRLAVLHLRNGTNGQISAIGQVSTLPGAGFTARFRGWYSCCRRDDGLEAAGPLVGLKFRAGAKISPGPIRRETTLRREIAVKNEKWFEYTATGVLNGTRVSRICSSSRAILRSPIGAR